jgi:hypothetical protein
VDSARSTGIGVYFLYFAESRGAKAVRAESSDSWEGAASIALAVKTLGLGASVSSVHPRSTDNYTITILYRQITILCARKASCAMERV